MPGSSDLAKLQAYLAGQRDVVLAYLFGSWTGDQFAIESDYDMAVLTWPIVSSARRYQLASELTALLGGVPVDLVALNRAPVELAYAVVAEEQRVFEHDLAARVEFEADVMSRYVDLVHTLREQRADLLRGGTDD